MPFFVGVGIERALYAQSGLGRGCRDRFNDRKSADERSAAPGLRDVAKQSCSILFHFDAPGGYDGRGR
jgi:hypothetical protein